jgi:FAD-binding domain
VSLALLLLGLLCRRRSFEFFLWSHKVLAAAMTVGVWLHVGKIGSPAASISTATLIAYPVGLAVQALFLRFGWWNLHFYPVRIDILQPPVDESGLRPVDESAVTLRLTLPFHSCNAKAGQYLNLFIRGLSTFSWIQSHPLAIAWVGTKEKSVTWDIIVQPRDGLTGKLSEYRDSFRDSKFRDSWTDIPPLRGYVSGPHGKCTNTDDYGAVICVAEGYGIAAQLSHLQQILQNRDDGRARTRRVSLIWQVNDRGRLRVQARGACMAHGSLEDYPTKAEERVNQILDLDLQKTGHVRCMAWSAVSMANAS